MDLGYYGNLSSPWRKFNHQHHQSHENPFSKEINTMDTQHISPPNPTSVFPNRPYNNMVFNSLSPLMPGFGINISKTTASLDSLDCLLSATNSINTDTSVEDDGISVIFSPPQQASPPSFGIMKRPSSSIKRTHDQMSQVLSFKGGENSKSLKKPRPEKGLNSSNISFQQPCNTSVSSEELDSEAIQHMKEMMYRAAAFRPVNLGVEIVEKPKRKNVKISSDPQTTAARERRERISERIRVLQRLVPGGSKMDTASMLDEAANYLKFLRSQVKALETLSNSEQYYYKFDYHHLVNFGNQNLVNQGLVNTYSLFPMQNLFPHQTKP